MKVHVIIPVAPAGIQGVDRDNTLAVAIASVDAQTAHSTHSIITSIEVGETGPSIARNKVAYNSNADTLAFLDNDDWWYPDYLEKSLPLLSNADAVVSNSSKNIPKNIKTDEVFKASLLHGEAVTPGSGLIVTRKAFEDIGGFDNDICGDDVYDFCLRLAISGKHFAYQPKYTWYRELRRTDHAGRINMTGHLIYLRRKALVLQRLAEYNKGMV
jgi:glycosyltransferase involved in cell wall biosynthesis